ncbi:hypothetical protein H4R24_002012 [Coemansia sp. RSA 988]|nr:hypothetical protein H4R24_002012 [Coemansia sp. RSA 988]
MTAKLTGSQERIVAGQNKTQEKISNSQDALLRRIDAYISFKETLFTTPLEYSMNLEVAISTPFVPHVRSSRNDLAHYIGLYKNNEHLFIDVSMMMILENLGTEWMDAWKAEGWASINVLDISNIQEVFDVYENNGNALCTSSSGQEASYQRALHSLMLAVKANLRSIGDGGIGVQWQDTRDSPIPNGQRLDGIVQVSGPDVATGWQNAVAIFELKSSRFGCTCSELRGQLLRGFIDMAEHQPRKHMLGFSVSGAGEIHIDLGFLEIRREGIYTRFGLTDIAGCSLPNSSMDDKIAIEIRGGQSAGGRNYHIVGAQSWIYNARVAMDGDGHFERAIFKFHWHCRVHSEIVVHKEVLHMGVPYVPKLVHSAKIVNDVCSSLLGEVLLMEHAGESFLEFFKKESRNYSDKIVDMLAGYLHTFLAAATVSGEAQQSQLRFCDEQYLWLDSEIQYIGEMNLASCPYALQELGVRLYRLLFGTTGCTMSVVRNRKQDSWLARFDASKWLQVLEDSSRVYDHSSAERKVYLDRLRAYVRESPQCGRFGTVLPLPKQALQQQQQRICEDNENIASSTPILSKGKKKGEYCFSRLQAWQI